MPTHQLNRVSGSHSGFSCFTFLLFWKSWLTNNQSPKSSLRLLLKLDYTWPRCYKASIDTSQCTPTKASGVCRKCRKMEAHQGEKSLTQSFIGWERWTEPWWGRNPRRSDPKGIPVFSLSSSYPCGQCMGAFSSTRVIIFFGTVAKSYSILPWEAHNFAWLSRPPRI